MNNKIRVRSLLYNMIISYQILKNKHLNACYIKPNKITRNRFTKIFHKYHFNRIKVFFNCVWKKIKNYILKI